MIILTFIVANLSFSPNIMKHTQDYGLTLILCIEDQTNAYFDESDGFGSPRFICAVLFFFF